MPEHYAERVAALAAALPTLRWPELLIGLYTLAVLLFFPRLSKKVPAPLIALGSAAVFAAVCGRFINGFEVATIDSRFSYIIDGVTRQGIPRLPPLPVLPWNLPGANGEPLQFSFALIRALVGPATAVAMLGAIESLLSAVVADGMAGQKHEPDSELLAQGLGNIIAPFFGGVAATGAIARTATNIRSGAHSPVAAITHALVVLAAVLLAAPLLGYLPMSALAALLLLVAWNMSEVKHFVHVVRVAPRSDVVVLLTCFSLTVLFDMVISVTVGVVLAALLFMRRMAELSGGRMVTESHHPALAEPLPPGVLLYEIAGPLFFGAAQKAMSSLDAVARAAKVVVLDVRAVPAIDATGLVNLESALERLQADGIKVVVAGLNSQPAQALHRAGWNDQPGKLLMTSSFTRGIARAIEYAKALPSGESAAPQTAGAAEAAGGG